MNKTTKQILTEARDLARKPHMLTSSTLVRHSEKAEGGYCYCALGLIAKASDYIDGSDKDNTDKLADAYLALESSEAVRLLANAIRAQSDIYDADSLSQVYHFNDRMIRAHHPDAVINAFDTAITYLDKE